MGTSVHSRNCASHVHTIEVGKAQVQDDDVRTADRYFTRASSPVRGQEHFVTVSARATLEEAFRIPFSSSTTRTRAPPVIIFFRPVRRVCSGMVKVTFCSPTGRPSGRPDLSMMSLERTPLQINRPSPTPPFLRFVPLRSNFSKDALDIAWPPIYWFHWLGNRSPLHLRREACELRP